MRLLVIGATGQIGRLVTAKALEAGHAVTALGRSIEKVEIDHPALTKHRGDVMHPEDVGVAMPRQDVVVMVFGAPPTLRNLAVQPDLREIGTRHVAHAMKDAGVRRAVVSTSLGAGDSAGHGRWMFRNVIEPGMLGRIMADTTAQEDFMRGGGVPEWVILRPAELADGPERPVERIADLDAASEPSTITRASVARVLVDAIADTSRDGTADVITNRPD